MERIIASKNIFSPVSYLEGLTGKCYIGNAIRHEYVTYDIDHLLRLNGLKLKSFPLNSIERAIKAKKQIILVDCSHYSNGEYIEEYRWYQINEKFNQDNP